MRKTYEETVVRAFPDLFTGLARKWFRGIEKQELSWSRLKLLLKAQFEDLEFDFTTEAALRARKQGASEKISNFVIEVRDLNSKLEVPLSEETLFNIIKFTLRAEYAYCLIFSTASSINEVVKLGRMLEKYAPHLIKNEAPAAQATCRPHLKSRR